jgi:hypothetical protein
MRCDNILKRFAVFAAMHLLSIDNLRSQLSQSPRVANRPGGAAVLAANLLAAKQSSIIGSTDLVAHNITSW